jgi:hypothetical protein
VVEHGQMSPRRLLEHFEGRRAETRDHEFGCLYSEEMLGLQGMHHREIIASLMMS